ncbi:MAG: M15 family metallopeptidase [Saprospiraceae bacterium]|nr:M15 family metallopeptidase [Saprospiraceae bacterium]
MRKILFAATVFFLSLFSFRFFKPNQTIHITEMPSNVSEEMTQKSITIEYITGKFEPKFHANFVQIDRKYADKDSLLLRKETYEAFKKMYAAAEKEGIKLTILSATRNFAYQKGIWERKWANLAPQIADPVARAKNILQFSAMPSTSRHHWGTDIDLDNLSNAYFEKGPGKRIYDWMKKNAAQYGFCQPYTAGRVAGYNEEKWHWTYLPLSKEMTEFAEKNLKEEQISGFNGAETAVKLNIVKNYVLGINHDCY